MNEIVRNATVTLPGLVPKPQNPELQQRISKLKQQQDQQLYNKMVSNISTPQHTQSRNQAPMTSGLNFAVTFLASVFATTFVLSSFISNFVLRVGIGFVVGTIVLVIEIFLAVRAIQKQEDDVKAHWSTGSEKYNQKSCNFI